MIQIRKLEMQDAKFMLEWMHDSDVVQYMDCDFKKKSLGDCKEFILSCQNEEKNLHRAIVNDENIYMGTVSLKNIDYAEKRAEFAITIRKAAMGCGYSIYGMQEILKIAFENLKLEYVYWYVNKNNIRAIKFYEKMNYTQIINDDVVKLKLTDNTELMDKAYWYMVTAR